MNGLSLLLVTLLGQYASTGVYADKSATAEYKATGIYAQSISPSPSLERPSWVYVKKPPPKSVTKTGRYATMKQCVNGTCRLVQVWVED